MIKKFIELSVWFNRKSQHYILGNWICYVDSWDYENGCWNKDYFHYIKYYPVAYIKFIWLCRYDFLSNKRCGE